MEKYEALAVLEGRRHQGELVRRTKKAGLWGQLPSLFSGKFMLTAASQGPHSAAEDAG